MSCVHYKFRSSLDYDTITFDGLSISLADLKREIMAKKKVGKNTDFDLEVTNAQTKQVYKDDAAISRNSSVVLRRIPMGTRSKAQLAAERADPSNASGVLKTSDFQDFQPVPAASKTLNKTADLANANASEEDKLKAMMSQAGEDWDPSQYQKGRRTYGGSLPTSYVCYRCGKNGHFIRNCPTNGDERFDLPKVKRTTGIPRSYFESGASSPSQDNDPQKPKKEAPHEPPVLSTLSSRKKVPGELQCPMCKNLLSDAVLIPCCGTSYCDDCIRTDLLENELQCPSCGVENVSPDSLVINKQLRQAVSTFRNARPGSPFTLMSVKNSDSPASGSASKPAADAKVNSVSDVEKVTPNNRSDAVKGPDTKEPEKNPVEKAPEVSKTKEDKPKQITSTVTESQPIKVRQPGVQGPPRAGPKFDSHRRPGEFHPRDYHGPRGPPPHLRDPMHRDPAMPHRVPPEQVVHVPALRPAHSIPHMVHPMTAYGPPTSLPVHPPTVMLPHPVRFAPPLFDPVLPQGELNPTAAPMSEEEFYRLQKKLKYKTETRHKRKREVRGNSRSHSRERPEKSRREHPDRAQRDHADRTGRHSSDKLKRNVPARSKREQLGRTKQKGEGSDYADELYAYRELQRSRQEHSRSRSRSRSRSLSRSQLHSGSWSYSGSSSQSHSSPSVTRSPTPEDWDKSRSPSPVPPGSAKLTGEKRHKHKKRKKHQKDKSSKKQKTAHQSETDGKKIVPSVTDLVDDKRAVQTVIGITTKKKHKKHKDKDKVKDKVEENDKESAKAKEKKRKISMDKEKVEQSKTNGKEKHISKRKKKEKDQDTLKDNDKGGKGSSKDNFMANSCELKVSVKLEETLDLHKRVKLKESESKGGTDESKATDKSKSKDKHNRKSKDNESAKKHKSKKKHKKKHKHQKKKKSKCTANVNEENGTTGSAYMQTEGSEKAGTGKAGLDEHKQRAVEQDSVSDQHDSTEEDTAKPVDLLTPESNVIEEASSNADNKDMKDEDSDSTEEENEGEQDKTTDGSDVDSQDAKGDCDTRLHKE